VSEVARLLKDLRRWVRDCLFSYSKSQRKWSFYLCPPARKYT